MRRIVNYDISIFCNSRKYNEMPLFRKFPWLTTHDYWSTRCQRSNDRTGTDTGIVPASEAKMSLSRMDQIQLTRYEEVLKQAETKFYANAGRDE